MPSKYKNWAVYRFGTRLKPHAELAIRRVTRIFVVALVLRTAREMMEHDATHIAAGVAYYAPFSLFPLLLGLVALLSFFFDPDVVTAEMSQLLGEYLPGSAEFVSRNIEAVYRLRGALGIIAIFGLMWSGTAIFAAISRAVNRA